MLTKEELMCIQGGAASLSTMLNAISKLATTLFNLGQSIGTSIRRAVSKKTCTA